MKYTQDGIVIKTSLFSIFLIKYRIKKYSGVSAKWKDIRNKVFKQTSLVMPNIGKLGIFSNTCSKIPKGVTYPTGTIAANIELIARLYTEETEIGVLSFDFTLGHEFSHKEDFKLSKKEIRNTYNVSHEKAKQYRQFVNWVNKTHADFGACKECLNSNINTGISVMTYKLKSKEIDCDSQTHPAWKRRSNYIKQGEFSENLIRQIANETNCDNEDLISLVVNYYKDNAITLK